MKINGIETTSIVKISGTPIASITKMAGVTLPVAPSLPSPTNAFDAGNASSYPGSGDIWYNVSGSSNATLFNGVAYDSGFGGGCFAFNGTDQYATASYDSTFDFSTGDYTMNTWVNFSSFGAAQNITSKDTYGSNFDWSIYVPSATSIYNYSNGTATNVSATVSLSTGTWYLLTIASIAGYNSIYVNGVIQNTPTYMSTSNSNTTALAIGCYSWNNPGAFFNGKMGLIEYYNVGLTDANVTTYFDNTKARFGY
jgi:hypothetical protein